MVEGQAEVGVSKHWYVYHLVDPRDRKVFYVGKGTGVRISAHEGEARRGVTSEKCNKIREIWAEGLPVERKVVEIFTEELPAFRLEAKEIARIGLDQLTNRCEGQTEEWPYDARAVRAIAWIAYWSNGFKREIEFAIPKNAHTAWAMIWQACNSMGPVKMARDGIMAAIEQFGIEYVNQKFEKHKITFSAA